MDNEFPDPDEEFDLLHEDEYEILRELEDSTNKHRDSIKSLESKVAKPKSQETPQVETPTTALYRSQNLTSNICSDATKKRSYEEFFGDISDILDNDFDIEHQPNGKKPRWDQPDKIIERVLAARNKHHAEKIVASTKRKYCPNLNKDSISLKVPPWNFIAITRPFDSQRIYVRVSTRRNDIVKDSATHTNLLLTPISQLKAEAEEILIKSAQRASLLMKPSVTKKRTDDELWVDKYQPKTYLELLSDETVNRHFLQWLKLWDKVVFDREVRRIKRKSTAPMKENKWNNWKKDIDELDSQGYPKHRIALLSGPPGLGKTTLAHLAAKFAGYNVVEVNASDERSPDAFRQVLLSSTQMKAVMGKDPRPNCIVLDEIDGAPAASIDLLLKFVQGKLQQKGKKSKGKKETEKNGCQRPVVCICNEPYTPSLKALRTVALQIPVPEVRPSRLAERLVEIAEKERLDVTPEALLKLAERTGCDVRSCLGCLQFMGGVNLNDDTSIGMKDSRKGLFDAWKAILTIPRNRHGTLPMSARIGNILRIAQSGETDRLAQGIFHNFVQISMLKIEDVQTSLRWFQFFDEISSSVLQRQNWSLLPYTNYAFVTWHLSLSKIQSPKLSYPLNLFEIARDLAKNIGILTAVRRSSGHNKLVLVTDFAPLLPKILTPQIRTISDTMLTPQEKAHLTRLVHVMFEFGLTYVQEKKQEGLYEYNLDPDLFEVGVFSECNNYKPLSYAAKQMVACQLEIERIRRTVNMATNNDSTLPPTQTSLTKQQTPIVDSMKSVKQSAPAIESKAKGKVQKHSDKKIRDFFGRIFTPESAPAQNKRIVQASHKGIYSSDVRPPPERIQEILKKHRLTYQYKEGYTNAVRRRIVMKDLL